MLSTNVNGYEIYLMILNVFRGVFDKIFLLIDLTFWIPNFFLAEKIKRGIWKRISLKSLLTNIYTIN